MIRPGRQRQFSNFGPRCHQHALGQPFLFCGKQLQSAVFLLFGLLGDMLDLNEFKLQWMIMNVLDWQSSRYNVSLPLFLTILEASSFWLHDTLHIILQGYLTMHKNISKNVNVHDCTQFPICWYMLVYDMIVNRCLTSPNTKYQPLLSPQDLDSAIRRRFEKRIYIPLPVMDLSPARNMGEEQYW